MEELQEAVGGASKTPDGEVLTGVVRQNEDAIEAPRTKEERKKLEFRTMPDGKVVRRQPLATRHLDKAETGFLDPEGEAPDMVDRQRYKVRRKYTFLYGSDLAYIGPVILWLTDEEIKGQEHKLEKLGGEPVTTRKDLAPPHVKDNQSLVQLKKKLGQLLSTADALKAEIYSQEQLAEERAKKNAIRTASRPPVPKLETAKAEKTNPPPEVLEELVPGQPAKRRGRPPKLKLPPADDVDLTAPPPGNVSRPPSG